MMIEISMIRDIIACFGVIAGFSYYVLTVRATRKNQEMTLRTRNITIQHQTINSMISSPMGLKYTRLIGKTQFSTIEEYRELFKDPEFDSALTYVFSMLDTWGIYLEEGIFDIGIFAKAAPWYYKRFWNQYKPIIYEYRKTLGPSYYRNMEYLFDSLEKYWKEHPEHTP